MNAEKCEDTVFVSVKPFLHQVGGHTCMFQVTPGIVCKPMKEVEVDFYHSLPAVLKPYVPMYYGMTDVRCYKTKGDLLFYAEVPRLILSNPCMKNVQLVTPNEGDESIYEKENDGNDHIDNVKLGLDNWCNEQVQLHFTRYGYWADPETSHPFIMLGNLVESYQLPCVLDLKMGTKQYAEKARPDKQKKMDEICSRTTSSKIGFRLSGFQVYKSDRKEYTTKDKFDGRLLSVHGVHSELRNFLHDGFTYKSTVIRNLIYKIQNLHDVLMKLDSYHFFCCSLLLFYDATEETDKIEYSEENYPNKKKYCSAQHPLSNCESSSDIRLIDFGNTFHKSDSKDVESDSGVLYGLKNLIEILKAILNER